MSEKDMLEFGQEGREKKKKTSYTLDPQILKNFDEICRIKKYNKSLTIENFMKAFTKKEIENLEQK